MRKKQKKIEVKYLEMKMTLPYVNYIKNRDAPQ